MTRTNTRHSGQRPCRRIYTPEQIVEMEYQRYQKRMSFDAIAKVWETTARAIEKQLCNNGNYYGDDRPLKAPEFDGWDFSFQNLPI